VTPDASDPIEELFARGVTDGLPVVPPTAERVGATVAASGRGGDELIGLVAPANGRATVERVAVNAVMAGCRPEYIPVVIAAVSAICDPEFSLVGVSGTTDAVTPLVIVNGPIRRALDVNCAASVFGAGFRANATIGRAVRLVWVNVGGARPGVISMSTFGQPGRYSYCIGEHEEASPWEPLSVEHGFAAADSTVAVLAAEAPQIVVNAGGRRARHPLDRRARRGRHREPRPGAARRHAARDRARARRDHRGGRLVEGGRAALRLGAVSGHRRRRAHAEIPGAGLPARARRRRHRRPVLGVGAGLAVPRRAVAAGVQGRGDLRATIGSCPSPTTRAFASSSTPTRCPCGCTTSPAWPSSR